MVYLPSLQGLAVGVTSLTTSSADKAIFGYGFTTVSVSISNLVSNLGVVAADTTGVGTARRALAAASYGGDKFQSL
jgi:hypothetical protein